MTGNLRIVHCFRSPVGGIFRHVRDLADAQVAAGHQVGIICDSSTGGDFEAKLFDEMERKLALGVRRTPMQRHIGLGDLAAAWRTYRLIKELKPDILHGHGAKGGVYARLFGSVLRVFRSRVARLYSPHGGSLHYDEATVTGRFFFLLEKVMDRFTDHLLFVSMQEREAFRRKVGVPKAPNEVVYNGVSDPEFVPVPPATDAADFLYVGMMRDLKGPDLFIEALAIAEMKLDRQLTAVMVGDGDDKAAYVEQAERLGLSERVTFHPAMPARQAFALGRTIVVPSRAEAMPYIVIEALAAGMPMIASAVGGIPEIFGNHPAGLTLPNAADIAAKMAEAATDTEGFRADMPPADDLRARFSARAMAASIERVYREALNET